MSQQINLLQSGFRKEPKRFSATAMLYACTATLLGIAVVYGLGHWQARGLQADLTRAEGQQIALAEQLQEVSRSFSARAKTQFLENEITKLEALVTAKSRIKEILDHGVFANTDGYSKYLVALARQHITGLWLTGFAIAGAGERLTLEGRTTVPELVPRYMQKLADEQTLAGIEFQVFRMTRSQDDARARSPAFIEFMATTAGKELSDQL